MKVFFLCILFSVSVFASETEDLKFTRSTLATLKSHGDNSSKERSIDFFFDFDSKKNAKLAATELKKMGFKPEVTEVDGKSSITTSANLKTDFDILRKVEVQFLELAKKFKGEYTGWGTKVVK